MNIFSLGKSFLKPDGFHKGELWIFVMFRNRTSNLIESLTALFKYIQKYEPHLNYNLSWIDTATKNQDLLNVELNKRFLFFFYFFFSFFFFFFSRKRIFE